MMAIVKVKVVLYAKTLVCSRVETASFEMFLLLSVCETERVLKRGNCRLLITWETESSNNTNVANTIHCSSGPCLCKVVSLYRKSTRTGNYFIEWHHLRKVPLSKVLKLIRSPFTFRSKAVSTVKLQRFGWNTTRYSSGILLANRSINWPKDRCKVVLVEMYLSNFLVQ